MRNIFQSLQWKLTLSHSMILLLVVVSITAVFQQIFTSQSQREIRDKLRVSIYQSIVYDKTGQTDLASLVGNSGMTLFCTQETNIWGTRGELLEQPEEIATCQAIDRHIGFPSSNNLDAYRGVTSLTVWDSQGSQIDDDGPLSTPVNEDAHAGFVRQLLETDPTQAPFLPSVDRSLDDNINTLNTYIVPIPNASKTEMIGAVMLQIEPFQQPWLSMIFGSSLYILPAILFGLIASFVIARGVKQRVSSLQSATQQWATGNFELQVNDQSRDEIGRLGNNLNQMAGQLATLLESRSMLASMETRQAVARDLHDAAKQQLFAATMQLSAAKSLLDVAPDAAREHLNNANALAKETQQELTAVINALRPSQLEKDGLFATIKSWVDTFSRQQKLPITLEQSGQQHALPPELENNLFRIFQEALSNVAKHSQATAASVWLTSTDGLLQLIVQDNGQGFDQTSPTSGFGLQSIRQRVQQLGGMVDIQTAPDQGTTLTVEFKTT